MTLTKWDGFQSWCLERYARQQFAGVFAHEQVLERRQLERNVEHRRRIVGGKQADLQSLQSFDLLQSSQLDEADLGNHQALQIGELAEILAEQTRSHQHLLIEVDRVAGLCERRPEAVVEQMVLVTDHQSLVVELRFQSFELLHHFAEESLLANESVNVVHCDRWLRCGR